MKKILSNKATGWLVALGLAIILLTELRGCGSRIKLEDIPPSKETIRYVPQKPQIKDSLIPYPVEVIRIDTVPANVDTLAILSEYFAKKRYKDTILFENAKVSIEELISENKIQWRNIQLDVNQKEITIERNFYEVPRNKVFIGASVLVNPALNNSSFSIDGVFIPKADKMLFQAGYDLINQQIRVGAAFKIAIRKGKDFKATPTVQ